MHNKSLFEVLNDKDLKNQVLKFESTLFSN